ncbi:MAG: DUF1835 domain-containing protein [Firmicutes bacterium]|nr:DUF1835 domain-containing protein [Bacillota bacterium]
MLEITFNTNAWLSLREAQNYGNGEYKAQGSPAFMFYGSRDNEYYEEQLEELRRKWHEEQRREWESAQPLGGKPQDVFRFELMLSMGHIWGDAAGQQRQEEVHQILGIYDENRRETEHNFNDAKVFLDQVAENIAAGESVRIWYSNDPDDYCGLLWFAAQLVEKKLPLDKVFLVKTPDWFRSPGGTSWFGRGTSEISVKEICRCAQTQYQVSGWQIQFLAEQWWQMENENSQLRAVVGGQPISVPDNFYDGLIWNAIESLGKKFREHHIIGPMRGLCACLQDAWIRCRLAAFVAEGRLEIAGPDPDLPRHNIYMRKD